MLLIFSTFLIVNVLHLEHITVSNDVIGQCTNVEKNLLFSFIANPVEGCIGDLTKAYFSFAECVEKYPSNSVLCAASAIFSYSDAANIGLVKNFTYAVSVANQCIKQFSNTSDASDILNIFSCECTAFRNYRRK